MTYKISTQIDIIILLLILIGRSSPIGVSQLHTTLLDIRIQIRIIKKHIVS